jgi:exodeoxyribonuclease VII large subunit
VQVYEVAQIAGYVNDLFQTDEVLSDLWLHGEVGDLSRPPSGHLYFSIRGDGAQIRCVLFRGNTLRCATLPALGEAVILHGALRFYEARGQCDLLVDQVYPAGLGLAHIQLEALRRRLEDEGLFDDSRKRALPRFPRAIGVVSSDGGAVIHDILTVLARRYPLAEVIFAPASVQGDGAPAEIVAALARLNRYAAAAPLDVIVVARGGGSEGELACFNDESVVRAAFACRAPVVSAIGHETDYTLLDYVADLRAPTPSAAAELITPDVAVLRQQVREAGERLAEVARERLRLDRLDLQGAHDRLLLRSPQTEIARLREQEAGAIGRAARALRHRLELSRRDCAGAASQLQTLNPVDTLRRGYSLVCGPDGSLVTSWRDVRPGDGIRVRLLDGEVEADARSARAERVPGAQMEEPRAAAGV